MKIVTEPQAALLRWLLTEGRDAVAFYPMEVFPLRNNAHNANRRMLDRLYGAGCLRVADDGRYVVDLAVSRAALEEWPWE